MTDTSAPTHGDRPLRVEPFQSILDYGSGEDPSPSHDYRFRILAANGEVIAQSEGYTTAGARDDTIDLILRSSFVLQDPPDAPAAPADTASSDEPAAAAADPGPATAPEPSPGDPSDPS